MSKYKRLERLVRINSLIRANLMDSQPGFDTKTISCKSNLAGRRDFARRSVEDNEKLVVNG